MKRNKSKFKFIQKYHRFENFLIFLICVFLFELNTMIFSSVSFYQVNYFFLSYFNDLLAPILLFSYINLILSLIKQQIYSLKYLIIIILLCSLVWEYLAIFLKPTSISDPIDILFYILGTLIYWIIYKNWIQKQNLNNTLKN